MHYCNFKPDRCLKIDLVWNKSMSAYFWHIPVNIALETPMANVFGLTVKLLYDSKSTKDAVVILWSPVCDN